MDMVNVMSQDRETVPQEFSEEIGVFRTNKIQKHQVMLPEQEDGESELLSLAGPSMDMK